MKAGMGTQGGMSTATDPSRREMRALVTRPRTEAIALAEALALRGVTALLEPLLDIHYRDLDPSPDLAGVQALLCTSANGVRAFARLSPERTLRLLAVGDATAARARAAGFGEVHSTGGAVDDLRHLTVVHDHADNLAAVALHLLQRRHGYPVDAHRRPSILCCNA